MVQIPSYDKTPPELSGPSLVQSVRFFSPRQKKILIAASAVFLAVLVFGGSGFYIWLTSFQKSQVNFGISGAAQAASGETAAFQISYWNNTKQILQNARLIVYYPQDALTSEGRTVQSFDLGDIGVGGGGKTEISLAFIGADKSIEKIKAVLSYKPRNTASVFENEIEKEVAINGAALFVDFKTPEAVLPNARNIYDIHYKNNTDKVFKNVSIEASYPDEFNFVSSDKAPSKNNNVWELGDLNPGEEGDIVVSGVLRNVKNAGFDLAIGVRENGKFFKFSGGSAQINLAAPPLLMDISVNGQPNVNVNLGDFLQFKIGYKNASGITLTDVVLKAKLDGLMYNLSSLKTNGFYNGADNTITWNAGNTPDFKNLAAAASGEAEFQINVKQRYILRTFRDKNFLLQVSATMETPTVPPNFGSKSLSVSSDVAVKVNTKAELKTKGYYYDAVIKNSGPLPPKVGKTTTYTVHWQVINYSNDIDGAVVKTVLPEGVSWLNKKAGAGVLEYNERTSELVWNIGKMQAGTGILTGVYEAVFQVALTPSVRDAGGIMTVIGDSTLTAGDVFTGIGVEASASPLKTDMPDDSGVGFGKEKVEQ